MLRDLLPRILLAAVLVVAAPGVSGQPEDDPPQEGEGGQEGEEMSAGVDDPVLAKLIPQARADLAERLSISEDDVEVVRAERVTWRDSSLGCPEEGMFYMQMLTDGALIELAAGGKTYPYHSNLEGPPSYCEKPSPAGPLPAGDDGAA